MAVNPYQQYQTTQVQTASTGDLILLLYDGAIRFLSRAQLAIEEGRLDGASADIVRGQDIVLELMSGLSYEQGGELAVNLRDLYLFMYNTLLKANVKKDTEQIGTVIRLLDRIRGAWRTVIRGDEAVAAGQRPAVMARGVAA
jgi:flagellar secretion chaperone FliS